MEMFRLALLKSIFAKKDMTGYAGMIIIKNLIKKVIIITIIIILVSKCLYCIRLGVLLSLSLATYTLKRIF